MDAGRRMSLEAGGIISEREESRREDLLNYIKIRFRMVE